MTEKQPSISTIQAVIIIVVTIGGLIFNYSAANTRAEEVERRVTTLEQEAISRNEYTELIKRLDRIEGKVDQIRK